MSEHNNNKVPIAIVPQHVAEVARVCAEKGVDFIGVFGIANLATDTVLVPKPRLNEQDTQKLMDYMASPENKAETKGVDVAAMIKAGQTDKVKAMLESKAITAEESCAGVMKQRPLQVASFYGRLDLVEFLLDTCKADVHSVSFSGKTALHYAAAGLHPDIARVLVAHGAKVDVKDNAGATPLELMLPVEMRPTAEDWKLTDRMRGPKSKERCIELAKILRATITDKHVAVKALLKDSGTSTGAGAPGGA